MAKPNKLFEEKALKRLLLSLAMFLFLSVAYGQSIHDLDDHFIGNSKIIVNWCKLDSLAFDIIIDDSGNVTGKIGNATIIQGKVKKNIFSSTKFIIKIQLRGYLIEKEGIRRETITIPFNFVDEKIIGGFNTSGSKFGGKDKMILSGMDLVLKSKK